MEMRRSVGIMRWELCRDTFEFSFFVKRKILFDLSKCSKSKSGFLRIVYPIVYRYRELKI
jgi:hypothetical protein